MADYRNMYVKLFNAVTDGIKLLQEAQAETEEMFIDQDDANISLLKKPEHPDDE